MPRRVSHPPYIQWQAPLVWTSLSLTLRSDGRAESAMTGASKFPRHWLYDDGGKLTHKSGLTDFADWMAKSSDRHTPWGDEDSEALVTAVETALEHELSVQLMHGAGKPKIERLPAGAVLVRQGEPGTDIYLVLDGVVRVERDGEWLAEYGPGALLGERALLEGGTRTSPSRRAGWHRWTPASSTGRLWWNCPGGTGAKTPARIKGCAYTCAASAARPPRRARNSSATAATPRASRSLTTARPCQR
jgi:CRP-like cAMP-binding protein